MREVEFTVSARGVGKPDYSREISIGKQLLANRLEYGEQLLWMLIMCVAAPGPSVFTRLPLAVGATMRAIDCTTGGDEAVIAVGWDYVIKEFWCTFDQDVYVEMYQGGTYGDISCAFTLPAGVKPINLFQVGWTRALLEDINVASVLRVSITNEGLDVARGKMWLAGLQKEGRYNWL